MNEININTDFNKFVIKDLKELCKKYKIIGYTNKKKDDLIKILNELLKNNIEEKKVFENNDLEKYEIEKELLIKLNTLNISNENNFINFIDLFAGTGGFSVSFEKYNKFKCVFANDMIKESEYIYKLNHPNTPFLLKDLHKVKLEEIPYHQILCGGFPCFVAGTQTLTNNGYKNIEDVEINDKLLTHNRKFQNILNLQRKIYTGNLFDIKIKYHPELITTTEEHPFYIREKKGNNTFGNSIWKKANELTMNDYFGMVINNNEIIPEFTFEKSINQYKTQKIYIKLDKLDYWFLMGYLVRNGWIEERTKEDKQFMYKIRFTINSRDEDNIFERINKVINITYNKYDTCDKFKKFECSNIIWYNILKQFGKYSNKKLIPEWVQDSPKEFIQEFINGYMKADDCINNKNIIQITTLSLNLAYGLQRLYLKLGHIFSINKCIRPKTNFIEARTVNQRNTYCIRGILKRKQKTSSFIEDNYVWFAPLKITKRKTTEIPVYNFEVENDNSYIIMNTIVHNCQPFSIAGEKKGFDDERSNVFWKILEIIKKYHPNIVILENVKNLKSHDEGNTYNIIEKNLKDLNYYIKSTILDTSKITNIPHHRERIYIVCFKDKNHYENFNFNFPEVINKKIKDFLEDNIDKKYYYTDKLKIYNNIKKNITKNIDENVLYQYRRHYIRENKSNCCPTLTANMGTGGHNVPLLLDNKGIRKLTPRECFNLQGFPSNYKFPEISDSALYKLAGNAISVPIVELIIDKINSLFD
jgi:DNA (cytosine-5)-methyltransferase 1